ncbi:hypothetical protein ABU614_19750 [Lysobacter firmicutimachus]|uniref:PIN domain-containing protein n=1 Tax=Lysobacter firmicutimachus TaxID=1792846 RepID=A0AAU8MQ69_9GAMM
MTKKYFLADTSSLVFAYRAGGPQLLDTYRKYWAAEGFQLRISTVVNDELFSGPLEDEFRKYIASRDIRSLDAPKTDQELLTSDRGERKRLLKNAGERSLVEIATLEQAAGRDVIIWSDDKYFDSFQIQRELRNKLPGLQTVTTAELLDRSYLDGFITEAQYQQHLAGYRQQDHFQKSTRLNSFDPTLSPVPADLPEGETSLRGPNGQRGFASAQLLIGEVPRNTLIRSGGLLASGVDVAASTRRVAELLEQDNPTAARSEATHAAARNLGGWVGGSAAAYAVGTSGYVPAALVVADAMLMSKAFDKAVDLKENHDITHQTDRQGVAWEFNGRNWVREGLIDRSADGRDNPVEGTLGANYDKARELGSLANAKAVELALGKVPPPLDPFDIPAGPRDQTGLDNPNWRRDPATEQWQRQVKTGLAGANDRGVYEQQVATPERAMELNREAVARIQHNIGNGREAVAAAYLENYAAQHSSDFVAVPAAVQSARPRPEEVLGSDGQLYRRSPDGEWAGAGRVAQGNLALELELTRSAREPSLQQLDARIAALDARPAPSEEQRRQNHLLHQYRVTADRTELTPEWQQAIGLAVQRTRDAHGIDGPGALQLQRSHGAYGADSSIAHYQRDAQGVNRLVAVTSREDILQARQEVLAGARQAAPLTAPESAERPAPAAPDPPPQRVPPPAEPEPAFGLSRFSREDQAMIAKIRASVPAGLSDEHAAAAMLAAKRNGIPDAERIGPVGVAGDTLWIGRTVPGFHTAVDLAQQAPQLRDTLRDNQQFNQEQTQKQSQDQEQQRQQAQATGAMKLMQ